MAEHEYLCVFIAPYQGIARECDAWQRCLEKSYTRTTDGYLVKFGEVNGLYVAPPWHRQPTDASPIIIVNLPTHSRVFDTPDDFECWLNMQFYTACPIDKAFRAYREHPNFEKTLNMTEPLDEPYVLK
jgi:hypothetical protein